MIGRPQISPLFPSPTLFLSIQLLDRFCQEDRVRIRQPRRNLQIKFVRPLSGQNEFVAYIDAIGRLDNQGRSEEHTSELQSRLHLVCRLLLEKKKKTKNSTGT